MLSIDHPTVLPHLERLVYGLQPIFMTEGDCFALVIKVTKEAILTARLNNEIKIYLLDNNGGGTSHLGFITAFFDDHDEPIVIKSLQFAGDEFLHDLSRLFSQLEFEVYFFDEHNRELLGVLASNPEAARFHSELSRATFPEEDLSQLETMTRRLEQRFAVRSTDDDHKAFTIKLGERLYPDDIMFFDARDGAYRFNDAEGVPAITSLEREHPGHYQERDIALMMGRLFREESIFLNPIRDDTGKELTDVMIVADEVMIFVQAKDSPNTEAALRRSIERKRSAIRSHIDKATKQLRGALSYASQNGGVTIRRPAGPATIPLGEKQLVGLVIVREMFDDDYPACSAPILDLVRSQKYPCILLDYSGLHLIARNVGSAAKLVAGLFNMLGLALDHDQFPKPVWNGPPRNAD
jgi:hypothetical protein